MLVEHLLYVSDTCRRAKYQEAIQQTLNYGDRVVDLGAGTGILGLMCLKAGAAEVISIDSTGMLHVARKTMLKAGLASHCTFIQGASLHAQISERVDLVVCDQVGYFGFDAGITTFLEDAKKRLLKDGGRLIPAKITLHLAIAESESNYRIASGWGGQDIPEEFHWLHEYGINSKYPVKLSTENIISNVVALGEIDFYQNQKTFYIWEAELEILRDGVLHGLAGWFDCTLSPGINMTNSPLDPTAINRPQAFFPISEAIQVKAGEKIVARIMAKPTDDLITWEVQTSSRKFSQSNAEGFLATANIPAKVNSGHKPTLKMSGKAATVILSYCDGNRTEKEIVDIILSEHSELMPTKETLVLFIRHLLSRDTH